tara:strand:+ start:106 stop:300 length:195 start_codon:yes stop_codon:yes gene_type:complete
MGLLKASIVFIVGNFAISLIENNINIIHSIPVLGPTFGKRIKEFIMANKTMALLIVLTIFEFFI